MTRTPINKAAEKQIRKVFKRDLMQISEFCHGEGEQLMAANPDPDMDSYYVTPTKAKMCKADFETGGATDIDGLEAALRELWAEERCPHFATLAARIAKIARSVRAPRDQSSELSQFVYVMH